MKYALLYETSSDALSCSYCSAWVTVGMVKYECGVCHEVASQCVQAANVNRVVHHADKERALLVNLILKMNAKLGGVNSQVARSTPMYVCSVVA